MNERILELAKEIWPDPNISHTNHIKFAELVVKECVQICNDTNDASYLNGVVAGRKIKQHFGVEE